jgi:phage gpG-like protein
VNFAKRVSKLERRKRFAVHRDDQERSIVEAIRERRRRRLEAEGRPFEEWPTVKYADDGDRPRTIAEAILRARAARRAASK